MLRDLNVNPYFGLIISIRYTIRIILMVQAEVIGSSKDISTWTSFGDFLVGSYIISY